MASRKSKTGCWFFLFPIPFAVVGVVMTYVAASTVWDYQRMQAWAETPATLLEVELESHRGDDSTTYSVKARYEYEFEGKKYEGTRVGISSMNDNIGSYHQDKYQELKSYYDKKQPFRCYVNPTEPNESILFPELRWGMLLLYGVFVVAFGGVGFGILGYGIYNALSRRDQRSTLSAAWNDSGESPPDEDMTPAWEKPRMKRGDWARGEVRPNDRSTFWSLFLVAIIWNAIAWPITIFAILPEIRGGEYILILFLALPLVGIVTVLCAIYMFFRWLKFGRSTFQMAEVPGLIGGQIAGVVLCRKKIEPRDGFQIELSCLQTVRRGKNTQRLTLWSVKRTTRKDLMEHDPTRTGIPILLAIPLDCEPTDPDRNIRWELKITGRLPGINYGTTFQVPVFKTPESREDFQIDENLTRQYGYEE